MDRASSSVVATRTVVLCKIEATVLEVLRPHTETAAVQELNIKSVLPERRSNDPDVPIELLSLQAP